jgi:hypothetical protein
VSPGAEFHPPRFYGTDSEVRRIVAGLLTRSLPRREWTHEAHLAALSGLIIEHHDFIPEQQLPAVISEYNVAAGGVNDDSQGYHETITQFWIASARAFHAAHPADRLVDRVNRFIAAPDGRRDAPLRHFSPQLLFSVEARRRLVEPDLMTFSWLTR